jgi:hypothetical protein
MNRRDILRAALAAALAPSVLLEALPNAPELAAGGWTHFLIARPGDLPLRLFVDGYELPPGAKYSEWQRTVLEQIAAHVNLDPAKLLRDPVLDAVSMESCGLHSLDEQLDMSGDWTVEAWVKPPPDSALARRLVRG